MSEATTEHDIEDPQPVSSDSLAEAEGAALPDDKPDPELDEPESANAEAARWRRRLRDAEAERDQLADQLDGARRQLVEQHAAGSVKPSALWASGATLDALIAEDGTVDLAAVDQAVATAREQFGIGGVPKASPRQGTEPTPAGPSWSNVVSGKG